MFDKITHRHETREIGIPYAQNITIKEHKAPTDKSIRLLNEMQEKAKKNIIQSVKIESGFCTGIVIAFSDDVFRNRLNWVLRFKLNEKDYIIEGIFEDDKLSFPEYTRFDIYSSAWLHCKEMIVRRFAEKVSSVITNKIMADIMNIEQPIFGKL